MFGWSSFWFLLIIVYFLAQIDRRLSPRDIAPIPAPSKPPKLRNRKREASIVLWGLLILACIVGLTHLLN